MSVSRLDTLAQASTMGSVEELAAFVARNPEMPVRTLARRTGLTVADVQRLLTLRNFRERVTELMTYHELSPDKERAVLQRMISVATDPNSDFRDYREAASWVFRQGGMLRGEKTQVETDTTIRVALVMDEPEALPAAIDVGGYIPPDPFAGVIGLGALPAPQEVIDTTYVPVEPASSASGQVAQARRRSPGPD
jgi:hypothetical protein